MYSPHFLKPLGHRRIHSPNGAQTIEAAMPNFQPISHTTHASKRWKRYSGYTFAAADAVAPLVVHELPKACMHLPLAFIPQGEHFTPVAVLGLQPGQNLLNQRTPTLFSHFVLTLAC